MQYSREGRRAGKKKENEKKKTVKAAPEPLADIEESNEHEETTSETCKPEARAASELVQPCYKLANLEEMAYVYLAPLAQYDDETREQMLKRTALSAAELFGAALKSPPTVVRAVEKEGPKILRRMTPGMVRFRTCVPTLPSDIVLLMARIAASDFACIFEAPDNIKSFLVVESWFQVDLPETPSDGVKVSKHRERLYIEGELTVLSLHRDSTHEDTRLTSLGT